MKKELTFEERLKRIKMGILDESEELEPRYNDIRPPEIQQPEENSKKPE